MTSTLDNSSNIEAIYEASQIIQEATGVFLTDSDFEFLLKLSNDSNFSYASLEKFHEQKNSDTLALEGIYFLYFHDKVTGQVSDHVNKSLLEKVLDFYSHCISANNAQNTEIVCYFLNYLRQKYHEIETGE